MVCCILYNCNYDYDKHSDDLQQENLEIKEVDSFKYHFNILDSVVRHQPLDTLYRCCTSSIDFMEEKTEIEPSSPGDFSGRSYFTKRDLEKWHEWYEKKYGKKR